MTLADSPVVRHALAPVGALRGLLAQAGRTLREGLARDPQDDLRDDPQVDPRDETGPAAAPPAPTGRADPRGVWPDEPDLWERRARAAEARLATLEVRLAAAERDLLELRSRNVCLQGKLAATSATARYQSLAMELEGGGQVVAR